VNNNIKNWFLLARVPFFSPAVFPFLLGSLLAAQTTNSFNWPVLIIGLSAVISILLACHLTGELDDLEVDRLSAGLERNRFSGGSQILVKELLSPQQVQRVTHLAIMVAVMLGLTLQFVFNRGQLTIPLGVIAIFCAWFYSKPPLRLVGKGIGEIMIAFCYGWLPIAVAYYLQTGEFSSQANLMAIPIALSCFNIILTNEFPDYPADLQAGKRNLVVRFGKPFARKIYLLTNIISWAVFYQLHLEGHLPQFAALFYLPFLIMSLKTSYLLNSNQDKDSEKLERACGSTIIVNLGTTLTLMLSLID
jgi:1,4-dihydroxy-2-naphthoate octaprenyltransferase